MANDLAMVRQLERFVRLRELHRGKAMTDMVKVFGRRPTKRWCGTRPAYGNRPCTNPRGAGDAMGIWRICCSGGGGGTAAVVGAATVMRFFRKALGQPHTVNPRTITVDKNPAYPRAVAEMKEDSELWRRPRLR